MIHSFHMQSVLKVIFLRVEKWNLYQCLGDIFLQIMSLMKIYTQYISNYSNSTGLLRELNDNPQWVQWKQAQEMKLGGMTLASLLIMPVQRVPRYILLLRDLFKHTWCEHPDYANLQQAASEMEELTAFLDQKKKESENLNRLAVLAAKFKGKISVNLVEAHRKFIREDIFGGVIIHLFSDLIVVEDQVARRQPPLKATKGSRRRSGSVSEVSPKTNLYWLSKLKLIEMDSGFQLYDNNSESIVINIASAPSNIVDEWVNIFKETQTICEETSNRWYLATSNSKDPVETRLKSDGLNEIKPVVSLSESSTKLLKVSRADSLQSLHKSLELLQSHVDSLDVQIKGVKSKKEKKQLSELKKTLGEHVAEVDKKLVAKIEERKQRARTVILKNEGSAPAIFRRSSNAT